ncbi:MAG: glycosyltransferase family 1 protein [Candidatus Latescibacterota bacterium]|nr:MAG: glycosyltransferase family 1 protein [Candidatus Latescibacterota bacterium]
MKIWLPYIRCGSGTDVYTERLTKATVSAGHEAVVSPFAHCWQYFPWRLRLIEPPPGVEVILANTWNGFAFHRSGIKLVVVEHHCIFDPAYAPYRSLLQTVFHENLVRRFEQASLRTADALVAVSAYTARMVRKALGGPMAEVIHNGIDTDFFCPGQQAKTPVKDRTVRLLFVGNLSRRKGADLLPDIMRKLGPGYELRYTSGLRTNDPYMNVPGMKPLGRLNQQQMLDAYRHADIVLFPTRLEGFGYAAAEAMACGTSVVATDCSSLPELIDDGVTGRLCPMDDVKAFAAAVSELVAQPERLLQMGRKARKAIEKQFTLKRMAHEYIGLFEDLLADVHPNH